MIFLIRFACVVTACVMAASAAFAQDPQPNVLIIYTDEQRFDSLGAMGNPDIETPHLDALAADGVLYRNSFCTWPVCTPSRLSLLTGQYVSQHGGSSNRSTLPPGTPTFATMLRDSGYRTAAVGKMHFTPAYQDVGFSEMKLAEQNGRGRNVDDYHRYLKERGLINALDQIDQERRFRQKAPPDYRETFGAQVSDLPDEHHITTWTGDRAVEVVSRWRKGAPGLLMVGFLKPHHPFDPPSPWHELYKPEDMTILPGWTAETPERDVERSPGYFNNRTLTREALQRVMAYYYATITHLDHHVGRIVDELKQSGLYDNTLIVFTSDHGDYLGFHHMILKSNHMYDPVIKVPLIIKYPNQRHKGEVSDNLVNSLDVTATILNETGQEPTRDMRGRAMGTSRPGHANPRPHVVAQDSRSVMVRTADRKLLLDRDPERSQFFDLSKDPFELNNRISDPAYAGDIAALKETALAWFVSQTPRAAYVDESVRLIDGPNVPRDLAQTEREMVEYFDRTVEEALIQDR